MIARTYQNVEPAEPKTVGPQTAPNRSEADMKTTARDLFRLLAALALWATAVVLVLT